MMVTIYVLRKKNHERGPDQPDGQGTEYQYEIWIFVTVVAEGQTVSPVAVAIEKATADEALDHFREAVNETVADDVIGWIWKTDGLQAPVVADMLASLPDIVQGCVAQSLEGPVRAVGVPRPLAGLGASAASTLILEPVLKPVADALHLLEAVGVALGVLIGAEPLVVVCLKHLMLDSLSDVLTEAADRLTKVRAADKITPNEPPQRQRRLLEESAEPTDDGAETSKLLRATFVVDEAVATHDANEAKSTSGAISTLDSAT
jgi:hypothetical protein